MNNPIRRDIGVYTVGGEAGDLEGWSPESLADALREPLAALLIRVECTPRTTGAGLEFWDLSSAEEDLVREDAKRIIDQVIEDGPE